MGFKQPGRGRIGGLPLHLPACPDRHQASGTLVLLVLASSIVTLHGAGRTVPGLSPCLFPSAADPDCCIRKPVADASSPSAQTYVCQHCPCLREGVLRFLASALSPAPVSPPSHPSTSPFLPLLSLGTRPLGPPGPPRFLMAGSVRS